MALKLSIIRNGAASLADVSMDDIHDCLQKKDGVVWIDATDPSFQEIDELGKSFIFTRYRLKMPTGATSGPKSISTTPTFSSSFMRWRLSTNR